MTLTQICTSAEEALQSAKGKLHALSRGNQHLQLTLSGHNNILAEQPLELSGIRSTVNGTWIAEEVTHQLKPGSYALDVIATPSPEKKDTLRIDLLPYDFHSGQP